MNGMTVALTRADVDLAEVDWHGDAFGLTRIWGCPPGCDSVRLLIRGTRGIKQPSVLKIERQTDLYLSTLRRFVEAAGGTLELRVELPGTGVIHLTGMGELNNA